MSEVIKHNSKLWERKGNTVSYFLFWCPGCKRAHSFPVGQPCGDMPRWQFNGNVERPSFTPSLLHFDRKSEEGPDGNLRYVGEKITLCHLFVTDGAIAYCADNPHTLNGQTVPMQDIPEDYGF